MSLSGNRFALSDDAGTAVLEFDTTVIVGRAPSAEHQGVSYDEVLQLAHSTVSSNHATLAPAAEGVLVTDLGSTNGTFINHQRLTGPTMAIGGDEIRFDTHTLTLSDSEGAAAPAVDAASMDPGATVVRAAVPAPAPSGQPDDSDIANAAMGQTMMMAVNKNLPRSWQNDSPGTIILKPGEANDQFAIDADALAAQFTDPTLVLLGDSGDGQPISLKSEGDLNFWNIGKNGSKHELSIVLEDPSVSDFHAKLVRRGAKWSVHDQMSTNKTRVNGEAVLKRFLNSKDVIEFGGTKALLLLPGSAAAAGKNKARKAKSGKAGSGSSGGAMRWVLIAVVVVAAAGAGWFYLNGSF